MNQPAIKTNQENDNVFNRYQEFKKQNPKMRIREIAKNLEVSEGELVASQVGNGVILLNNDASEILKDVVHLGEVMALTRNEYCVSERNGVYDDAKFFKQGKMSHGLFVNPDIDLRLFMSHWKFCFANIENAQNKPRKSLQFFDKAGVAIHKIYLVEASNESAFDELVEKHKASSQDNFIEIEQYKEKAADLPDDQIDWKAFRGTWENMQDTHDFYPMLLKYKTGRKQALRNIGKDFAYEVNNNSARQALEISRDEKCEIMVFVGNRGGIQIHTGAVEKLVEHGSWYNVLDSKFNLHLNEDAISSSWVTKKPTADGIVTSLEIFDKNDELIVTFFGKRKPGIPELPLWRKIVDKIPQK